MNKVILAFLIVILFPLKVLAFGEIFVISVSGTEYCDNFNARGVNEPTLWVNLLSDTELTVSFTPDFAPGSTFPMYGHSYQTGTTAAAFAAGVLFVDGSWATIQGTAKIDRRSGAITSLKGAFIQSGVIDLDCFSSGKFTSQKIS